MCKCLRETNSKYLPCNIYANVRTWNYSYYTVEIVLHL